jgi:hypothetical protein
LTTTKPFNFLLACQASQLPLGCLEECENLETRPRPKARLSQPKPIAPYDSNTSKAAVHCFDRETAEPIPRGKLKTYREALAQYHLRPESKFLNGERSIKGRRAVDTWK